MGARSKRMMGTAIPWRVVLVPVVAAGLGLLVHYARHDQPPAGSTVIDLDEPPTIESPEHEAMMEPAPPGYDVATVLHDIGVRTLKAHPIAVHSETWIAADGTCVRPSSAEQKQLRARVAAWIDQTYRDEKPLGQIEIRYGCEDATGIVVEGNVDRVANDKDHTSKNRGWILEIASDSIKPIDERTSTAKQNWMEWANEGTLTVLALIDLDHDGAREVVWTDTEHEGASVTSDYTITTLMHRDARPVATVHGFLDATLIDHTVVFSIGAHDEHVGYRCLT